jgi:hypothetical protein
MNDIIPRIGGFFAPLAIKIGAGIILALSVALALALWRADSLADARDEALKEVGAVNTRLAVSNASLVTLEGQLDTFVKEGALMQEQASSALLEAQEAGEAMREAAQETGRTDWRGVEGI